jgi:hypothetical protein
MSAIGPELTSRDVRDLVAIEGKADITSTPWSKMYALRSTTIFPIRNVSEGPSGSSAGNV